MLMKWTRKATGTPGGMVADADELRRGLKLFADPDAGCEIMALKSGQHKTLAGSDINGLVDAAEQMPAGIGLYIRLNPCPATLSNPATNTDILKRRWLYIDIDPFKAIGQEDNPATKEEKVRAGEVAERVLAKLSGAGWPAPIIMDSGNGWALFYRVDLPNSVISKSVIARLMKTLSDEFSGPDGIVDKSVHNANRLTKLPGTWAKKGTESPERPYRVCRILSVPSELIALEMSQIEAVAGIESREPMPAPAPSTNGVHDKFTLRATAGGKGAYGRAALDKECARVSLAGSGNRNNALNEAAFSLGQLVAGGELERNEVEARLTLAALSAGLDNSEITTTLRSGLNAGMKLPRVAPERPGQQPVTRSKWQPVVAGEIRNDSPVIYKLSELLTMDLPEPKWAIPGLLSEGLTILCGKPKLGKSWMALNLAMTIAAGGLALGSIRVQPAHVLYLALEDRLRRIQDRARKVMKGLGSEANDRLQFAVEWPSQDKDGVHRIAEWAESVKASGNHPALVIIDVWAKFRSASKARGNAYEEDYTQLSEVKSMGDYYGMSIMPIHHTRKSAAEDVFDEVSGTQGISGAADGTLILARSRGQTDGTLAMTGRDIEEQTLSVSFDVNTFCWTSHGSADEKVTGDIQKKILAYMQARGVPVFAPDIAAHVERTPEQIRPILHRMFDKKILSRVGNAWSYPAEPETWAP